MTATTSVVEFGYSQVAPLDWFQWRCLLWDHFPEALRAGSAEAWSAIAKRVNGSCPGSSPHQADDYERAFSAVRRALPDATSGLEIWTRSLYQQVPRLLGGQPPFMNLGFMDEQAPAPLLDPTDEPFRLNIQLYERALGRRRLRGQSVLECGCGGGGGLRYLAEYHDPAQVAGVDLLPGNIAACRLHDIGVFEVADASRLPFPGECFDAVISIESSGHYERPLEFLREVTRVLKPGGIFYLADLRPTGLLWGEGRQLAALHSELQQAGLAILEQADLSDGVLSSILLQESGRRQFLDALALDPASRAHFDEIMLMRGSRNFEFLANGDLRYLSLVCEKPGKV